MELNLEKLIGAFQQHEFTGPEIAATLFLLGVPFGQIRAIMAAEGYKILNAKNTYDGNVFECHIANQPDKNAGIGAFSVIHGTVKRPFLSNCFFAVLNSLLSEAENVDPEDVDEEEALGNQKVFEIPRQ